MDKGFDKVSKAFEENIMGSQVRLRGWIHRKFHVGGKIFIRIRDSSGIIQCVIDKSRVKNRVFKEFDKAKRESSVWVEGIVKEDTRAPCGREVVVEDGGIVGYSDDFPIKGGEGIEFLLDNRHLWLRSTRLTNIMKVKHTVLDAIREYHRTNGWWEVTPPILTGSAVEGGATLFSLDYFGQKAYLSQSAQLYLEVLIYSLEKVWAITPSFRAEKSRTRRHLAEYTHFEVEAAWMDMEDMMVEAEKAVSYVVERVLQENERELKALNRDLKPLERVKPPFPRITYSEAVDILNEMGKPVEWGEDFGADEESLLTSRFEKPFFITHFPKKIKAFYMKLDEKNPSLVKGFDLLAPEGYGEIIGGSQREDNYDKLYNRILEEGYDPNDYKWYLDLRKYGTVPHSGYGLGIERLVMWLTGIDHIRDATPFPRFRERLKP
jgi:asparaginyl-tRNA synthetase